MGDQQEAAVEVCPLQGPQLSAPGMHHNCHPTPVPAGGWRAALGSGAGTVVGAAPAAVGHFCKPPELFDSSALAPQGRLAGISQEVGPRHRMALTKPGRPLCSC